MRDATNNILIMFSYGTNIASGRKFTVEVLSGAWGGYQPSQTQFRRVSAGVFKRQRCGRGLLRRAGAVA